MERYKVFGKELNRMTVREVFEAFFADQNALYSILEKLAAAAEERIEELKQSL